MLIAPGLSQARHSTFADVGDIFDLHRQTVLLRHDNVANVFGVLDQTQTPDVDRLIAHADRASADVYVGVANGGKQLLKAHAVRLHFFGISLNVVLLGGAAPGHNLGHTGHGQQAPLDHPILDGAQSAQAVS